MPTAHIPYDAKLLVTSGRSAEEIERECSLAPRAPVRRRSPPADINQRGVELPFVVLPTPPSTVRVAVPSKASQLLPRGFYMAFVVTNQGVPSKAAFVRIQ